MTPGPNHVKAVVKAVLGPTNTGKTHLAITRLLAHSSGIIGFPLRLLARENYDRMVAAKGLRHVALITGEEKIVPPEARWFSCTVEAMPLDRQAEFLAIDEIQLCADPDRGHVFTDRLLHARGLVETMVLGSETIRPLLTRLVPGVQIETRPRLSQLAYAGPAKLIRLPPRTAIVAFSAAEVYAIAEMIRRRRGGCAVVMGRLSPRTRNAQVALYQEKEVDFLVATDAIGMGLNMDVDHVAFAGLQKFDGHRPRRLSAAEVAQIAGRAGRGMRDGTFGTTATCPPLVDELVAQVEAHRFESLGQLVWRNGDLDFSSIDALLASLTAPPPGPGLVRGNDASDLETLSALAREPETRGLAQGRRRVRQLWDACQVPDFRKIADDSHVRLCARVFLHVARDGKLPTEWLDTNLSALARNDGDIDTLMQRLASVRVWTYIAARPDWVANAAGWQERARAVEDQLSDALHERLTARFVDRRAARLMQRLEAGEGETLLSAVTAQGDVVVEGHPVGRVDGFAFHPDPLAEGEEKRLVLRAARRALREEMPRRVSSLLADPDGVFALAGLLAGKMEPRPAVTWRGAAVARLRAGERLLRPQVEITDSEFLDGAARERLRQRVQAWLDRMLAEAFAPLHEAVAKSAGGASLRGPAHRVVEAGGLVVDPALAVMPGPLRGHLRAAGLRAGRFALFVPELLKPRPMALRAMLWSIWHKVAVPALPLPGQVSVALVEDAVPLFWEAMGWLPAGPVRLRIDIAERVAAELAWATRRGPAVLPAATVHRLSLRAELLPAALRALGFRLMPSPALGALEFGPPVPPLLVQVKRRVPRAAPLPEAVPRDGPFAALSQLRVGTTRRL